YHLLLYIFSFFFLLLHHPPRSTLFPYTTLFRSQNLDVDFGFTIIGAMSLNDLRKYQNKVKQKLTNRLKSILTATNAPLQYQIRRPRDVTTVMVKAQFFI